MVFVYNLVFYLNGIRNADFFLAVLKKVLPTSILKSQKNIKIILEFIK